MRTRCHSQGIEFQLTTPYSPSQNGVAKRANRTLVELSRAMLSAAQLPEFLWEPAVAHAVYIRNISYTVSRPNMTPYQAWNGDKPDVSHLRAFGAPVWVLLQGQNAPRKMLPKSQRRVYVGYDHGPKAIKYYNAKTRSILLTRNFWFLTPSEPSPPDAIAIEHHPPREGEAENSTQSIIPQKRTTDTDDETQPHKTRGKHVDYKYLIYNADVLSTREFDNKNKTNPGSGRSENA